MLTYQHFSAKKRNWQNFQIRLFGSNPSMLEFMWSLYESKLWKDIIIQYCYNFVSFLFSSIFYFYSFGTQFLISNLCDQYIMEIEWCTCLFSSLLSSWWRERSISRDILFYCFNMYIILFIENLETMRQKFVHGNFYTYKCSSQYCKRNMDEK
jgi:hypothetical protein